MEITFVTDPEWPGAVISYMNAVHLIEDGKSFTTIHLSLMDDAKSHGYDRITIISDDGKVTLDRMEDGYWDSHGATERRIRSINKFYHLWKNGEFTGEPFEIPAHGDKSVMDGTPSELQAMLRQRFDSMRNYVKGYTSIERDGELVPGPKQEEALDEFDRSIWRLELSSTGMAAKNKVRTNLIERVGLMEAERELCGLLLGNAEKTGE